MSEVAVIVEDNAISADIIARQLQAIGFPKTHTIDNAATGIQLIQQIQPRLVVIDERLPDASGTDLVREVRQVMPTVTIIMCTVVDDETMMQNAFTAGCNYYTVKPNGFRNLCSNRPTPKTLLTSEVQEFYK